ncbi:cytochrome P450 [Microdochium bolleyi]|uniref:Cytochrome P450 n=1 Tax=Microdochium bolleyi TaxID=196109 RepID=A0A136IQG8_9PEZI|nr:cytochrome P450 [Microdochium bolleyi]
MVLFDDAARALPLVGATAAAALAYFVVKLVARRRFYANVPCPPHSFVFGHLKLLGEYMSSMPRGGYIQQALTQMKIDYDLPEVFYLDMWPVVDSFICFTSPEAATYPTTANVWAIPPIVTKFFELTTGTSFIEATNGPLWKELLHRLAPALTPTTIKAYFPHIVAQACILRDDLAKHNKPDDEPVRIQDAIGRYPFQVIAHVIFGEPLSEDLYRETMHMLEMQLTTGVQEEMFWPWKKRAHERKLRACVARIDVELSRKVRVRFAELQQDKSLATQRIVDRMLMPQIKQGLPLDDALMQLCLSNIKGLVLAGYGTTNDTTTYIWLLLSTHPDILQKLRAEHDRVFGTDQQETINKLLANPSLLSSLEYTAAVINETLRLYPIGMVARQAPLNQKSAMINGKVWPLLPDQIALISGHAMHYSEQFFPDAKRFLPDRFGRGPGTNSSKTASPGASAYPRNAYRPFERGPRSCIGQALAMDEMKIQLVVLARAFDLEVTSAGVEEEIAKGKNRVMGHADMESKLGRHAYQVASFTAGPAGTVMMKVRERPMAK